MGAQREILVNQDPLAQWESKVLLDQRGLEVPLEILAFLVYLEKMESLDHLVREEHLVLLDHLGPLESLDLLESQEFLELLVYQENLDDLGNQERKGLQDHMVLKADLDYLDHLVCQDFLEREVFLVFRECLA